MIEFRKFWIAFLTLVLISMAAAQNPQFPFAAGTPDDEAAIRKLVKAESDDTSREHVASNLDFEDSFGVRYNDLGKRDKFFGTTVKPSSPATEDHALEVKVRFIDPANAVADEYWHIKSEVIQGVKIPDRWGRTTYVLHKGTDGWTLVLERDTDLRGPYFKHYDKLPVAFPVPAAILASYAGSYEIKPGVTFQFTVNGDHLDAKTPAGNNVAIPVSTTDFLLFKPEDLAEYLRLFFSKNSDGSISLAYSEVYNDERRPLKKIK